MKLRFLVIALLVVCVIGVLTTDLADCASGRDILKVTAYRRPPVTSKKPVSMELAPGVKAYALRRDGALVHLGTTEATGSVDIDREQLFSRNCIALLFCVHQIDVGCNAILLEHTNLDELDEFSIVVGGGIAIAD
jgi:hypothetical protein